VVHRDTVRLNAAWAYGHPTQVKSANMPVCSNGRTRRYRTRLIPVKVHNVALRRHWGRKTAISETGVGPATAPRPDFALARAAEVC
jgi:hypothetical protein